MSRIAGIAVAASFCIDPVSDASQAATMRTVATSEGVRGMDPGVSLFFI